jgi:tRNA(fMet)-specific endonuclease VapC
LSFLLDTDIRSAYLKGHPQVGNRVLQYGGRLYVSAITVGELYTWAFRAKASPQRLTELLAFLKDVTILEIDESIGRRFGEIRAARFDAGLPCPDMDLVNAATALVHGLTMVTHNTQDYADVPGLSLADWLNPSPI